MEKREHHLDDDFKKDAAPEGIAVVGPGQQPEQAFARRCVASPTARPTGTGQSTIATCRNHRVTPCHGKRQADHDPVTAAAPAPPPWHPPPVHAPAAASGAVQHDKPSWVRTPPPGATT